MLKIKRINIFSVAKIFTFVYGLIGFVVGLLFTVLAALGIDLSVTGNPAVSPVLTGIGSVVILPFLYGILGFISGIFSSALYNLAAKIFGGIEIQTE